MRDFEVIIPIEYMNFINREIKNPKRLNTELLELWLERELDLENPGSYGNLPTDESHVTVQTLPNGNYKITMSNVCFDMIKSHVQPEPHSRRKLADADILRCWLEIKIEEDETEHRIKVKELT
jgi:hypothetical protein